MKTAVLYTKDGILYSRHYLDGNEIGGGMFGKLDAELLGKVKRDLEQMEYVVTIEEEKND